MKKTFEQVLQKVKDKLFGKDKGDSNDTSTNNSNNSIQALTNGNDKTNELQRTGGIFKEIEAQHGTNESEEVGAKEEQRKEGGITKEEESLSTYVKTEQRRSGGIAQSILNFKEQENRERETSLLNKAYKKQAIKSYEEFINNSNSLETTNQNNSSNNNLNTKDNPQQQNYKTTKKKKDKGNSR